MKTDNLEKEGAIKDRVEYIKPFMWKPGQSGNPAGRPKGKTMKEYTKEMLERLTDEERDAFLMGMPKEIIWRMAEGNPHTTEDKQITIKTPVPILGGATASLTLDTTPSPETPHAPLQGEKTESSTSERVGVDESAQALTEAIASEFDTPPVSHEG